MRSTQKDDALRSKRNSCQAASPRFRIALSCCLFLFGLSQPLQAQSALSDMANNGDDFFLELEGFANYGGEIKVVNGLTGEAYNRSSAVVKTLHSNIPKIMGGLHLRLLDYEIRHMNYQIELGRRKVEAIAELAQKFGIPFELSQERRLSRELSVLRRLQEDPIFQFKELVVWERNDLSTNLPDNQYARHIRYDFDTGQWQRRVITEWVIKGDKKTSRKVQGLNLDTQRGFHDNIVGLPGNFEPKAMKDVNVSYPIILYKDRSDEEQIEAYQRELFKNLSHLYDPFTWGGRRDTRFRKHYEQRLEKELESVRLKIDNREWFDEFLARFIDYVVRYRIQGLEEVYAYKVAERFDQSNRTLGVGMDQLNWHPDEDREGRPNKRFRPVRLSFDNTGDAALVLFDAFLRHGNVVIDTFAQDLNSLPRKTDGKDFARQVIEKATGYPSDKYIQAALQSQAKSIALYRDKIFQERGITPEDD